MILSRKAIRLALHKGLLAITPFSDEQIQPAHIDLHLDGSDEITVPAKGFVLAQIKEKITLSGSLCAFMEGRAGLAKQGISIEQSSTFVEPGSDSQMTLEIFNASTSPVTLAAGQPIAKLFVQKLTDEI